MEVRNYFIVISKINSKEDGIYVDDGDYLTRNIEYATCFGTQKDAEDWIETVDNPEEFEVKKLKIIYEIEEI